MRLANLATRPVAFLGALLMLTALFAITRVEGINASSGGCCSVATCNFLAETCNGDGECYHTEECCLGGCY